MGNFVKIKNKKYITYKVYDNEKPDRFTVNTLKIVGNDFATLIKNNVKQTRMIFEKNRRHYCPYYTDFGVVTMGVFTSVIDFKENPLGGSLRLKYSLDMNSSLMSVNEINIEFKKLDKKENVYV